MNRSLSIAKSYFGIGSYYDHIELAPKSYPAALKALFKRRTGSKLNLSYPQTFNEKIQWLKLYGPLVNMGQLADKYIVREYVKNRIGEEYLVPLLGVYDGVQDINYADLPNRFVIKATHGCGFNVIVPDKDCFDADKANKLLNGWLDIDFSMYTFEMQYRFCNPKLIAEQYLDNGHGLDDYKFWCFDGKVDSIQFLTDRSTCLKMAFYDRQWSRLDYVYDHPVVTELIPRPPKLELMIELAEALAAGHPYARIDFYLLNDGSIRFGEITFTSASGLMTWMPSSVNEILGEKLDLSRYSRRHEYLLKTIPSSVR